MAENEQNTQTSGEQAQFAVQRLYIKDSSFESPNSPKVFGGAWKPEINLDLNTNSQSVAEGVYEVVLTLTVTAKNEEQTAFLAEIHQAGIFMIKGLQDAALHQTLGAFCPNILFPYAREAVDSLVNKGSFPSLMLAPVNFDALYAEQMKTRAEAQETH